MPDPVKIPASASELIVPLSERKAEDQSLRARTHRAGKQALTDERLLDLLEEAADLKKHHWGYCPDCHKKVQIEKPNYEAVLKLLLTVVETTEGKAGVGQKDTSFVVQRTIVAPDGSVWEDETFTEDVVADDPE